MTTKVKNQNAFKRLWGYFTTYEKCWYLGIVAVAIVLCCIAPEEGTELASGLTLTILCFFDIILALMGELLASKQSRWGSFVYNFFELGEILIAILTATKFATMATAIFFWIPIHTITFINWRKHRDKKDGELTVVRSLKGWQSLVLMCIIVAWTAGIGYLLASYGPDSILYETDSIKIACGYMDACLSILSIADGFFLLFRYKEAWYIWYVYLAVESAYYILLGRWEMLVLEFGYLTNCIYGLRQWNIYIKNRNKETDVQGQIEESAEINASDDANVGNAEANVGIDDDTNEEANDEANAETDAETNEEVKDEAKAETLKKILEKMQKMNK